MSDYYDSDYYDSDHSDGEPYLQLIEDVRHGRYTAVLEALDQGSNPNDRDDDHGGYTILHRAAGLTDEDSLEEIGTKKPWNMPQRRQIVRLLLDRGAIAWSVWFRQDFLHHTGCQAWDLTSDQVKTLKL